MESRKNQTLIEACAAALRDARHAAGLSQEELAGRADLSARHISHLETARRQPSLTVLAALSEGLGITMAALCEAIEARAIPAASKDKSQLT